MLPARAPSFQQFLLFRWGVSLPAPSYQQYFQIGRGHFSHLWGFCRPEPRPFDNFFCLDGASRCLPHLINNSFKSDGAISATSGVSDQCCLPEARPFDNFFCLDGACRCLPHHINNSFKSDGASSAARVDSACQRPVLLTISSVWMGRVATCPIISTILSNRTGSVPSPLGFLPARAPSFSNFFCLDGACRSLPHLINNSFKSDGAISATSGDSACQRPVLLTISFVWMGPAASCPILSRILSVWTGPVESPEGILPARAPSFQQFLLFGWGLPLPAPSYQEFFQIGRGKFSHLWGFCPPEPRLFDNLFGLEGTCRCLPHHLGNFLCLDGGS